MAERRQVGEFTVSYSGIFTIGEMFHIMKEWIKELDYKPSEQFHSEKVAETGK